LGLFDGFVLGEGITLADGWTEGDIDAKGLAELTGEAEGFIGPEMGPETAKT
jgi:hypothetical protein